MTQEEALREKFMKYYNNSDLSIMQLSLNMGIDHQTLRDFMDAKRKASRITLVRIGRYLEHVKE